MLGAPSAVKEVSMALKKSQSVDWEALFTGVFRGKTVLECGMGHNNFQQGQPEDTIESGRET
jgi:hypothetical protein